MTVVETGVMIELVTDVVEIVMIELVVEAGGKVVDTVDVGCDIEVVDGNGVSQTAYSQFTE